MRLSRLLPERDEIRQTGVLTAERKSSSLTDSALEACNLVSWSRNRFAFCASGDVIRDEPLRFSPATSPSLAWLSPFICHIMLAYMAKKDNSGGV